MKKLFVLLIACVYLFSACDGSVKNPRENALIYDDYLQLDFIKEATPAGDHTIFNCELSLEEIKVKIDNIKLEIGTITSNIINDRFLLIEKLVPLDKVNYYLIADVTKNTDSDNRHYNFSACSSSFSAGSYPDQTHYIIHVPHHYFIFDENDDYPLTIRADVAYELTGTKQDIFDFYNKIKIYDVENEADCIKVKIKADAEIYGKHTKTDFVIYFEENDGKSFAHYKPE